MIHFYTKSRNTHLRQCNNEDSLDYMKVFPDTYILLCRDNEFSTLACNDNYRQIKS